MMLLVLWAGVRTCLRFTRVKGSRAGAADSQARAHPSLWPLVPLSFPMASPCRGRSVCDEASYNQPQGVRVAARRNLTQEPYTPRSAAGSAVGSAAGGRSLPRSLREGLRPHLPTGLEPTLLSALMMLLRCYTFSEWFGSTDHPDKPQRKYSAGKTGRAENLLNGGDTSSHLSETQQGHSPLGGGERSWRDNI